MSEVAMKKWKQILALLLLPAFLLTGCWQETTEAEGLQAETSSDTSQAEEVGSNTPVLPTQLALPYFGKETLDPVTCRDGIQQTVTALLYEGLYELDENLEPQPKLCTGGSYDAETLTWTFSLHNGVVFSDGSPLTAADAAATLNRAMASERYGARLVCVQSVSAVDGQVVIVLKTANTALPALLDIPIVKSGTETDLVPLGTGPYKLISDDSGAYLSRSEVWWGGSTQPTPRIGLVSCTDEDTSLYQFISHNVQLVTADLTSGSAVSTTGSFEFHDADTTILQYVGINVTRPPFNSAALRRALGLGIDRGTLVSAYLSSHGKAAQFPVSPCSQDYPSTLETTYSYSAFESAMTAAGYHTGAVHNATMIVNSENSFKVSAAKFIAAALSAFDLNIEIKALPWAEYTAALSAGDFDLYYGEVKLTADWNLQPLLGTGGALNYGRYADPALDLLLSAAQSSSNRASALKSVCISLQSQAPILPVCFKCTSVLSQEGVLENLTPTASNPFYDLPTCVMNLARS
jgi:peptide/nickel transport system substrate-binding protein